MLKCISVKNALAYNSSPLITTGGKYHCTVDLLFDWFGISCFTTDNFCLYLQNKLIQTGQTGGQLYSDTLPFSVPWTVNSFYSTASSLKRRERGGSTVGLAKWLLCKQTSSFQSSLNLHSWMWQQRLLFLKNTYFCSGLCWHREWTFVLTLVLMSQDHRYLGKVDCSSKWFLFNQTSSFKSSRNMYSWMWQQC
jgi:hypothetical protein